MDVPLLETIKGGGVVADGAMGSLLYERGIFVNRNFDEVNLSQSELVYKIHHEYVLAGAQVLETNTYGANLIRLARHGLGDKAVEINRRGAETALEAAAGAAYVVGSIGPTGLTPSQLRRSEEEVQRAFLIQAQTLIGAGCHGLIIETFTHPTELRLAVEAAREATKLAIIAQVIVNGKGEVEDGTDPVDLAHEMVTWGADVVGANCCGPSQIFDVAAKMVAAGFPVCGMPNAGHPETIEDRQIYLATPESFGVFARRMFKAGIKMVGGCCGTRPDHIKRASAASRMIVPRQVTVAPTSQRHDHTQPAIPIVERSRLGRELGKRFVFSVEVNPSPGISIDKPLKAAKMLLDAGADFINIADGPRATARMSNLALGVKMQTELNAEVLLHVCCRDHNLLGLQANILGCQVLGIRDLVIITGDPPKVGDYPDATAVYDLDSIGLLKLVNGLNQGVDPAGKAIKSPTSFVLATGAEPAALDFEREIMRLKQKVEAGANLIMTQPIYDPANMERFLEVTQDIDIPVLVGILPLASHKNAEFIHNHIPGMAIPEDIRERMRDAGKGEEARNVGVQIALEALNGIRDRVAGAYIMPPLGRYEMAAQIIEAFGDDRSIAAGVPGCSAEPLKAASGGAES